MQYHNLKYIWMPILVFPREHHFPKVLDNFFVEHLIYFIADFLISYTHNPAPRVTHYNPCLYVTPIQQNYIFLIGIC